MRSRTLWHACLPSKQQPGVSAAGRSKRHRDRPFGGYCGSNGGAVFEITPKNVVVRKPVKGICACTNHFRSEELATNKKCYRYDILARSRTNAAATNTAKEVPLTAITA